MKIDSSSDSGNAGLSMQEADFSVNQEIVVAPHLLHRGSVTIRDKLLKSLVDAAGEDGGELVQVRLSTGDLPYRCGN